MITLSVLLTVSLNILAMAVVFFVFYVLFLMPRRWSKPMKNRDHAQVKLDEIEEEITK